MNQFRPLGHLPAYFAFPAFVLMGCSASAPHPAAGLDGEAGPSPVQLSQQYRDLASAHSGPVFEIDPGSSKVSIFVFRAGAAAAVSGHNHVLRVPQLTAYAFAPPRITDARFDVAFRLDQLLVDDSAARAESGDAFSTVLDGDAVAGTREHMLSPKGMDAEHFPTVTLHSVRLTGELPRLIATVAIDLHGVRREQLVPIEIEQNQATLRASGTFAIRQTDFGITPYSVLGGLLGNQDEISIAFQLNGHLLP